MQNPGQFHSWLAAWRRLPHRAVSPTASWEASRKTFSSTLHVELSELYFIGPTYNSLAAAELFIHTGAVNVAAERESRDLFLLKKRFESWGYLRSCWGFATSTASRPFHTRLASAGRLLVLCWWSQDTWGEVFYFSIYWRRTSLNTRNKLRQVWTVHFSQNSFSKSTLILMLIDP